MGFWKENGKEKEEERNEGGREIGGGKGKKGWEE